MKRGFLNTPRSRKVIEEAYAPKPPAGPTPPPQGDPPSPPRAVAEGVVAADTTVAGNVFAMKRGFLNTPRSKNVIEEAYASPPRAGPTPSPKHDPSLPPREHQGVTVADDAMVVDTTAIGDVSNAGGNRVVAEQAPGTTEAELHSLGDCGDHRVNAEPPSKDPKGKGKCKEKVVDTNDDPIDTLPGDAIILPPRPPPGYQGWGRDPDEEFFHRVPETHGGRSAKRAVFLSWPRDPNGKSIMPTEQPKGTLSPDGFPWGATLYDFYHVRRFPDVQNVISIMTGSAIWEAMRELGELDAARDQIEWAKSEGKPRVEGVANTGRLIKCMETRVELMSHDTASKVFSGGASEHGDKAEDKSTKEDLHEDEEDADEERDEAQGESQVKCGDSGTAKDSASVPPLTIPITSPFHPSHYPKPWPFIPFETPLCMLLQERIPLYLLPQTLHVHDPFALLSARKQTFRDTSWKSRPDIIRTYNLKLSQSVCKEADNVRRKAEELEEFKARTLIILRYKRTKEQIENHEPVIEVPLPPYPRRMTKVEDSHLYLSPVAKVGEGHHSIVYKGEWELPRDLFTRSEICRQCFKESVAKEIQRLKDTGRWEKLLRAGSWGPTGFTGHKPTQAELDEANDLTNLERDGEIIEREITCIVFLDVPPSQIIKLVDGSNVWDTLMGRRDVDAMHLDFTQDRDEGETEDTPVPTIRIDPPLSYETQKPCTHGPRRIAIPRTARFTVVAKLSLQHDNHLPREARNYQQFPEHFFHHYNGYTIISQLHTIVPVHAVVPQFYGYYTPETLGEEPYLSPILLLEHCGEPIEPETLCIPDQEECASLLLRFQRAGWLHESVAPRNFLVQFGKPTEFPLHRERHPELSFRLIDFGRSRKFETAREKQAEEMEALHMFERLNGRMNLTF